MTSPILVSTNPAKRYPINTMLPASTPDIRSVCVLQLTNLAISLGHL